MRNPEESLKELKGYLRIDFDEDDQLLVLLMDAAGHYLKNAGVSEAEEGDSLYWLAVMLYVGANYENRDGAQKSDGFSHALQSIILQLKDGI